MMDVRQQAVGGKSTPHSATAVSYSGNVKNSAIKQKQIIKQAV